MKKSNLFKLATFLTLFIAVATTSALQAQKPEVVSIKTPGDTAVLFTVKTATYNGAYAPKHVFAIWITNSSDQIIRTLEVRANAYKSKLFKWNIYTGGVVSSDAISGASLTQHTTHTVKWNGKDTAGQVVPDGVYNLWVEYNETNNPGNPLTSIQFTKGAADQHITPANTTNFQNIDLQYFAPIPASVAHLIGNTAVSISPNPSADATNIELELTKASSVQISIYSLTGKMVHRFSRGNYSEGKQIFLWSPKESGVASGTYFVHVTVDQKNQVFKLIIN